MTTANPIKLSQTLLGEVQLRQDNIVKLTLSVDECLELLSAIVPWNKRRYGANPLNACDDRFSVTYSRSQHCIVLRGHAPPTEILIRQDEYPQFCDDLLKLCANLLPRAL